MTKKLTKRQIAILDCIRRKKQVGNKDVMEFLKNSFGEVSRITVVRDLDSLLKAKLIKKNGSGRSVKYEEFVKNKLLQFFDQEEYFKIPPDKRVDVRDRFNFEIFSAFTNDIFSREEKTELDKLNNDYRKRIKKLSPTIMKKEFERLTVELSWKSSQIEGNTYSLIDTEILIKEQKEAAGHTKEEAIMILNHKNALNFILEGKGNFKMLTLQKIEHIHRLLIQNLGVNKNVRKKLVGITGTRFRPLDNTYQIREALEKMNALINNVVLHPLVKALAAILLVSYIQPFEDGNKRTARLLGNAVLLAHDYCPLSYRSIDEGGYKKATLLFYEQHSALLFKKLFSDQFRFAVQNYFSA